MQAETKLLCYNQAKIKDPQSEPIECFHCKIGYFIWVFPTNGGYFCSCNWCHTKISVKELDALLKAFQLLKDNDNHTRPQTTET